MVKPIYYITAAFVIMLYTCEWKEKQQPVSEPVLPVTFAVFGNTGCVTDNGKTLKALAEAVNDYDVDFAVDLGNRLPVGIYSSGIEAFWDAVDKEKGLFDRPVYPVVGKNDIFDYESDVAYSRRYGPLWYSFRHNGVMFIVLNTEDDAYRFGFGLRARMGEEQLLWLERTLEEAGTGPVVVFMHRPLWEEAPLLWRTFLQPLLKAGNVDLAVTCSPGGLFDWGKVDGIRVVSSGCTGPVKEKGIGLFPHVLSVTVDGGDISFIVHSSDGIMREGIEINGNMREITETFTASLRLPKIHAENSWRISESLSLSFHNRFAVPVSGTLDFTTYENTRWKIEPASLNFNLEPGILKTIRLSIRCSPPEFGPHPTYRAGLKVGDTDSYEYHGTLQVNIPRPRTGEVVPISAHIADVVPYSFGSGMLGIPVEIDGVDTCGRLIIYREGHTELPVCQYISGLRDLRSGLNEFYWNGRDMEGEKVSPDTLTYMVCVYNKKAPVTWVAVGPPSYYGTVTVERTLSGLIAKTHDEHALTVFSISGSSAEPKSRMLQSFADIIEEFPLNGFAYGEKNRLYLGTAAGIVCVLVRKGNLEPDISFGDGGYVRFTKYRGREIGSLTYHDGVVYTGMGGGESMAPCIVALDGKTGEELWVKDLGVFYGEESNPPAVTSTERGLYCAHPDCESVIHMAHNGDLLWINDAGDRIAGLDTDGRSFAYGIGVDQYGFTYVNTPGYSARCGVLGPDGLGLFRVILVQLPGLRVSSVVPMIEGKKSDGLYFVTRNGDVPYVFHLPYTVRSGIIVDEAEFIQ